MASLLGMDDADACLVCKGTGFLLCESCPLCEGSEAVPIDGSHGSPIAGLAIEILANLRTYRPMMVPGMDSSLHYLPPHIPKATWTVLGDLVAARERSSAMSPSAAEDGKIHGSHWISLRLDGSGFSRAVRMLRRHGILEQEGFSEHFAVIMVDCLKTLIDKFHGRVGYTQSDEMIVFIPPTRVVKGEQMPHTHGGRVTKLTTLAASLVTSHFVSQLTDLLVRRHIESGDLKACLSGLEGIAAILPHFDCRVGHYDSWEEAQALLMWRAYDCSVNGVSDAVYHSKGSGKEVIRLGTREKLEWLWKNCKLPLPRHQAYGTVLVRTKREVEGLNPMTNEVVKALRSVVDRVDGPVLELLRSDRLFPDGAEA